MLNCDTINQGEQKLAQKNKRREKKIKPKMKVSGKSVQKMQRLIKPLTKY